MKPRKLEWGCTPWDDLTREELLREVQRAYAAVSSAEHVLTLVRGGDSSGFWGPGGSGHGALEMCEAVVKRVDDRFDSESVYRSFFRYAVDLLFSPELGMNWSVCEAGHMVGRYEGPRPTVCRICKGVMRALEWGDLEPRVSITGKEPKR